jgi:hypothetical protein
MFRSYYYMIYNTYLELLIKVIYNGHLTETCKGSEYIQIE